MGNANVNLNANFRKWEWIYTNNYKIKKTPWVLRRFALSHKDSNLGKQNQNLMCYHYTMGQWPFAVKKRVQKYKFLSVWTNFLFENPLKIR